jgi:hypothetical protein
VYEKKPLIGEPQNAAQIRKHKKLNHLALASDRKGAHEKKDSKNEGRSDDVYEKK